VATRDSTGAGNNDVAGMISELSFVVPVSGSSFFGGSLGFEGLFLLNFVVRSFSPFASAARPMATRSSGPEAGS